MYDFACFEDCTLTAFDAILQVINLSINFEINITFYESDEFNKYVC